MKTIEADIAIVGSGVCGLLTAWAPLQAGLRVAMLERGALKTHAEQLADQQWEADVPGARHNDETAPGTQPYPWSYVYGVGGSTLHWDGATPRFSATDFKMRSTYGVMVDWPLSLEELLPYYRRAEQALGVSGAPAGGGGAGPELPGARSLPPHPLSPMDRAVAPHLSPFRPLPQARPSRPLQGRPACCGSATCELCPVDARFSPLNGLRAVLEHPGLELREQTVAARLRQRPDGRGIEAIEAIEANGDRHAGHAPTLRPRRQRLRKPGDPVALGPRAAQRSAAISSTTRTPRSRSNLRSDPRPGTRQLALTGVSEAFREGRFRSRRSAAS